MKHTYTLKLREELGVTYREVRGHGCLRVLLPAGGTDTRRAAEELKEELGATYRSVRGHGCL